MYKQNSKKGNMTSEWEYQSVRVETKKKQNEFTSKFVSFSVGLKKCTLIIIEKYVWEWLNAEKTKLWFQVSAFSYYLSLLYMALMEKYAFFLRFIGWKGFAWFCNLNHESERFSHQTNLPWWKLNETADCNKITSESVVFVSVENMLKIKWCDNDQQQFI